MRLSGYSIDEPFYLLRVRCEDKEAEAQVREVQERK